jgi:hypothetical protein
MTKHLRFAIVLGLMTISGGFIWKLYQEQLVKPPETENRETAVKAISILNVEKNSLQDARATPPSSTSSEKALAEKKLEILNEIFKSKNDNDPRMDQDLKNLSTVDKVVLKEKYNQLPVESRNERGTIIFLLGRNINANEDLSFLDQVFSESKCMSLENCTKTSDESNSSEHTGSTETTLAYPQIVALKALENYLAQNPQSAAGLEALKKASKSPIPLIAQMSARIAQRLPQ